MTIYSRVLTRRSGHLTLTTEHIIHVRIFLALLNKMGVTLKLKKCSFVTEANDYLGQTIRPSRLEVASHTTDAICELKALTSLTKLHSLPGLRAGSNALYSTTQGLRHH